MIRWSSHAVFDGMLKGRADAVRRGIEGNQTKVPYYVVTLSYNPRNLLDIWKAKELHKPYYRDKDLVIVGVSLTKEGAKDLAVQILEQIYRKTGGFDLPGRYDPPRRKERSS
ncbi:MAG: hypothetical protein II930_06215 [Lachnospiraceae bacterium]|nr:hypothetical protein [Lachnospiraceae bacterium]